MFTLAVTGGAGTGKSTVTAMLVEHWTASCQVFDSDAAVHRLLERPDMARLLGDEFGAGILGGEGKVERGQLRELVFADASKRERLEALLHPRVREEALAAWRGAGSDAVSGEESVLEPLLFVFEVPLLFEVDFDVPRDKVLVVASSESSQRERLGQRSLTSEAVDRLLDSQLPVAEKILRADRVIWNDGRREECREQVRLLCEEIAREEMIET